MIVNNPGKGYDRACRIPLSRPRPPTASAPSPHAGGGDRPRLAAAARAPRRGGSGGTARVKRHVVREALAELERVGLVERIPNRGAVVRCSSPRRSARSTPCREALETLAAEQIPLPVAPEVLAPLRALQQLHAEAVAAGDARGAFRANMRFHETLFRACGNPHLVELIQGWPRRSMAPARSPPPAPSIWRWRATSMPRWSRPWPRATVPASWPSAASISAPRATPISPPSRRVSPGGLDPPQGGDGSAGLPLLGSKGRPAAGQPRAGERP